MISGHVEITALFTAVDWLSLYVDILIDTGFQSLSHILGQSPLATHGVRRSKMYRFQLQSQLEVLTWMNESATI